MLRTRPTLAAGVVGAVVLAGAMLAPDREPDEPIAPPVRPAAAPPGDVPVADVQLGLLQRTRPEIRRAERNLFRFQARPTPAPRPPGQLTAPAPVAPPVTASGEPSAPPPIPIRFIGLVDAPTQAGRIAILSDGRGNIFYGREGAIIEGRYKVLEIGPDAADLSYLDGRGRQTIRLSGQ